MVLYGLVFWCCRLLVAFFLGVCYCWFGFCFVVYDVVAGCLVDLLDGLLGLLCFVLLC